MTDLIAPRQAALLLLCGSLLAVLVYEGSAPLSPLAVPELHLPVRDTALPPLPVFQPPSPSDFSVINERPVFSPQRLPVKPAVTQSEIVSAPPPQIALIGIITDGQNKLALVKMPGAPFAMSVGIGGDVGGWQVSRIDLDGLVLHSGQTDIVVKMNGGSSSTNPSSSGEPHCALNVVACVGTVKN